MKRIIVTIIILLSSVTLTFASQSPPWVELTLHPAKATKTAQQLRLLLMKDELTDDDAVPIYQKAIESFPDNFPSQQFSDWRKTPPGLDTKESTD